MLRFDMVLAGFLAHRSLTTMIISTSRGIEPDSLICRKDGIPWVILVAMSAAVAVLTTLRIKENKIAHGIFAFVSSFLINFSGNDLGHIAMYCSFHEWDCFHYDNYDQSTDIYFHWTIPIMALLGLFVMLCLLKRRTLYAPGENTNLLDPEIILLGVCVQSVSEKLVHIIPVVGCWKGGMGFWLELFTVSGLLAAITFIKTNSLDRTQRLLSTFFGSLIIHLTMGRHSIGWWAISCTLQFAFWGFLPIYDYVSLVFNGTAAVVCTRIYLINSLGPNPPKKPW